MAHVGLVLGAGGLAGHAWHVGVLTALADRTGWDPRAAETIVGTSAGAGVGSYLRAGLSAHDLLERLRRPPGSDTVARLAAIHGSPRPDPAGERTTVRRRPQAPSLAVRSVLTPWRSRPGIVLTALVPSGRRSTAPIASWSQELHGDAWPRETLWLCAVDLGSGRRVVFGRDDDLPAVPVARAVEASCAVPGIFRPVEIGGRHYVDGGAHSPTNADLLLTHHLDAVVVSSPMSASSGVSRFDHRAYHHRLLRGEAAVLRAAGIEVIRLEPSADVVVELRRARAEGPPALAAAADAARRSVAAHLDDPGMTDRLAPLATLDATTTSPAAPGTRSTARVRRTSG